MALVSWYHEGLDRFVQFAEEAKDHMERSGWVRKDDPAADVPAPEVAELTTPVDPAVPPPVGDDIVQGGEHIDLPPADETDPEHPAA